MISNTVTFGEMIADVNANLPGLPSVMVKDALQRTYRGLCRHWPFHWLEETYNLGTFASFTTPGYLTVTSGGTTVTGITDGTSATTFLTSSGLSAGDVTGVYRIKIAGQDQTYLIKSFDSETQLTLRASTPYIGDTLAAADEAEYVIFKNEYELDTITEADSVLEVVEGMRSAWGMSPVAAEWLDEVDPRRATFGQPTKYCIKGGNPIKVELWPIPDAKYVVQYWGRRKASELLVANDIPLLDGDVIVKGALVNLAPKFVRLYPSEGKTISAFLPLWKNDYDEALSDLIRQDGRTRTERREMVDQLGWRRRGGLSSSLIEYDLDGDY